MEMMEGSTGKVEKKTAGFKNLFREVSVGVLKGKVRRLTSPEYRLLPSKALPSNVGATVACNHG